MKIPLWGNKQREKELNEELESHLQMAIADRMARGESLEQATILAKRELGNITLIKEVTRTMWGGQLIEQIIQDLLFGVRILKKSPVFTVIAILSLAFGIGANMAVFQLLNAVSLRLLPVNSPEELAEVRISSNDERSGHFTGNRSSLTYALWQELYNNQTAFSGIFAWNSTQLNLSQGGEVQLAKALYVSGDFFNVLEVKPVVGRMFTNADDKAGCGSNFVVISYQFWQRQYGGQASVIGKTLSLNNNNFEIIGVTPASFYGVETGKTFDVAIPICSEKLINKEDNLTDRQEAWWLGAIGRLKPGISIEQASVQLNTISSSMFQKTLPSNYTKDDADKYVQLKLGAFFAGSGISLLRKAYETPLWVLMAITGLVLLIACANLANLLLARASAREKEIAVKLALGASRVRLVRQFLLESLLLAALGTVVGAFIGRILSSVLITFISTERRQVFFSLELDWRVFSFTVALAILTCLLFGLIPALRATSCDPAIMMKAGQRGLTASQERFGLRRILVISQVALSLVLLVSAILFINTLRNLNTLNAGFQQNGVLITTMDMASLQIPKERRQIARKEMLDNLRNIPGVESAAETFMVAISGNGWNEYILVNEQAKDLSNFNAISDKYFETLEIPILAGRDFNEQDNLSSPKVAIVNESFKRKFFPDKDAVGKTFRKEVGPEDKDYLYEIVGVVKDTKYRELKEDFGPIVYVPISQQEKLEMYLTYITRSKSSLNSLISAIKSTTAKVNPSISLKFTVFSSQIKDSLVRERLMATLAGFFGILATILATIGLYGVMSYMVTQRRNEIGIRMALGADRGHIIKMILLEACSLLAVGLVVGTLLSLAMSYTVSSLLFGLKPYDFVTFTLSIVILAIVGIVASFLPAQRASKLDPMIVLKND